MNYKIAFVIKNELLLNSSTRIVFATCDTCLEFDIESTNK